MGLTWDFHVVRNIVKQINSIHDKSWKNCLNWNDTILYQSLLKIIRMSTPLFCTITHRRGAGLKNFIVYLPSIVLNEIPLVLPLMYISYTRRQALGSGRPRISDHQSKKQARCTTSGFWINELILELYSFTFINKSGVSCYAYPTPITHILANPRLSYFAVTADEAINQVHRRITTSLPILFYSVYRVTTS